MWTRSVLNHLICIQISYKENKRQLIPGPFSGESDCKLFKTEIHLFCNSKNLEIGEESSDP